MAGCRLESSLEAVPCSAMLGPTLLAINPKRMGTPPENDSPSGRAHGVSGSRVLGRGLGVSGDGVRGGAVVDAAGRGRRAVDERVPHRSRDVGVAAVAGYLQQALVQLRQAIERYARIPVVLDVKADVARQDE